MGNVKVAVPLLPPYSPHRAQRVMVSAARRGSGDEGRRQEAKRRRRRSAFLALLQPLQHVLLALTCPCLVGAFRFDLAAIYRPSFLFVCLHTRARTCLHHRLVSPSPYLASRRSRVLTTRQLRGRSEG